MTVQELNILEVLIALSQEPNAYFYHNLMSCHGSKVLGFKDADTVVAMALLSPYNDDVELVHLYTVKSYTDKTQLFLSLLYECTAKEGRRLWFKSIVSDNSHLVDFAKDNDFAVRETSCIYRYNLDRQNRSAWTSNMDIVNSSIAKYIARMNIQCKRLAEVDEIYISQLKGEGFEGEYSPSHILNGCRGQVDTNSSYIAIVGDTALAVALVVKIDDENAMLELLKCRGDHVGTGVFIPTLCACVDSLFNNYKKAMFCISNENAAMNTLISDLLKNQEYQIREQKKYCSVQPNRK